MTDIVLTTINARYIHTSFGLRYLLANLGTLRERAKIIEFENAQRANEIAERLLASDPKIIGFGVYIWNRVRTEEVVSIVKKIRPDITIVLGGPEVSYEYDKERLTELCDYIIVGEGEFAFRDLCTAILEGKERPTERVIQPALPEVSTLSLPYDLYSADDIAHRVIYVEISRGCPFTCEFCLSSINIPVRQFDCDQVLNELDTLYQRGARTFKFVDRTFNLHIKTSIKILEFFLARMTPDLFVHFEMVPDRFPEQLRRLVREYPPGSLQLEIGVQSLNPTVGRLISRRQDIQKLEENLRYLREETNAHLHVDLIVGLPGEDLESFGQGFDTLIGMNPQEIQIGILKRLRGTPIVRHSQEYQLKFSDTPPYEILETKDVTFDEIQRMERFARYWDLIGNSGNFRESREYLWKEGGSAFVEFLALSDWLYETVGQRSSIQLKKLTTHLYHYLVSEKKLPKSEIGEVLARDYMRGGRTDVPPELKEFAKDRGSSEVSRKNIGNIRQLRVVDT